VTSLATRTLLALAICSVPITSLGQTLEGFASFPADTFAPGPGPTSGQFIAEANGRVPPFVDKQPVQGISSVLRAWNGDFLVMSDNGFGAQNNSADYVLRVYRVSPDFRTRWDGDGSSDVRSFITLRDPGHHVNFPIVADREFYYASSIPVDPEIRERRLLTGADFDIEAFRDAPDGTLWFGDEFGPFLLHTDRLGRVLEAPIPLPGVQSPQNPFLGSSTPNLPSSRGFEGMAITPDGKTLYPMLEGPLTAITDTRFLVIERDQAQGAAALFKKIFIVDLKDVDQNGFLVKQEVADLLNIADPLNLGGQGPRFTFPFQTIESVIPLGPRSIGVLDDNNYPFSNGRVPGQSDPNEFIILRLDRPLVPPSRGHHKDDDDNDRNHPCSH